jgi:hypothetical protein
MQSAEFSRRLGHAQSYLVAFSLDSGGGKDQEENQALRSRAAYAAAHYSAIPWLPPPVLPSTGCWPKSASLPSRNRDRGEEV